MTESAENPPIRELPIKTSKGEGVSVVILDNPSLLSEEELRRYAQAMVRITGEDILPEYKVVEQFHSQGRRWYFLRDPQGQITSYGMVSLQPMESGGTDCYISKIATDEKFLRRGYATAILDAILTEGFDRVWTFNAIAGTPQGDALRRMHEERGFIPERPVGQPGNLVWQKPK